MVEINVRIQPGIAAPEDWALAERAARSLLDESGKGNAEVSVLLTDDNGIHELNRLWRGIDKPTDVLSWPQEAMDGPEDVPMGDDLLLGDVAISVDTTRRQAMARGWTESEEAALLLVHGILHLLGHEDDSEEGAEEMRGIEKRILGRPLEKTDDLASIPGKILV